MAFAIYRAPIDFARPDNATQTTCNGTTNFDDLLVCRPVEIQVQDTAGNTASAVLTVVRPPVAFIHGLWDSVLTWLNFSPLVTGPATTYDQLFFPAYINYGNAIPYPVISTGPPYSNPSLILNNSLGFDYNAGRALRQLKHR